MGQYIVTGMGCAACSARMEKAMAKVPGITSYSVSLLTNSIGVEESVSSRGTIGAVEAVGYGATVKGEMANKPSAGDAGDMLKDREIPVLKHHLCYSLGFLIVSVYFSMGHMMWNRPVPAFFADNHVAMGPLQLSLTGIVMMINRKLFINGSKGLIHRTSSMDTLVALGSEASFVYSVYALFAMTDVQVNGDMADVMSYIHEFYFKSAAMILILITVGKVLEARSKGRATDALRSLVKLASRTAILKANGAETEVPTDQVKKGDISVVRPGENIPVNGIVLEGSNAMDESALTGESIPVDRSTGNQASVAIVNRSGYIVCETPRVEENTTLSQIIQMVSDAAVTRAPIAKVADRVSGVFVPTMIAIAAMTMLVQLIVGESIGFALARGISVLVISCPCALGLTTPAAIIVGNEVGTKHGIMFKTAVSLEETGKMEIVILDRTGTTTSDEPRVTNVTPAEDITERQLLKPVLSLEKRSEHSLAKTVFVEAGELNIQVQEVSDFKVLPGNGLSAALENRFLCSSNFTFISSRIQVTKEMKIQSERPAEEGKTSLFFSRDGMMAGIVAMVDTMKEDNPQIVKELQDMRIHVMMFTSDNERTARAVGKQAGVDKVTTGVLPDGEESTIRFPKKKGGVTMMDDSVNDAPALTRTDIGITIGAGTDIAIDAADVVLMKSRLGDVPAVIRMSRATLHNIHENLFWAFFYNAVGISLAAGPWYSVFGWKLSPMFGAAAMSLSSSCVVTNAFRLNFFEMYDDSRDKGIKVKKKKEEKMVKTMKIGGMMYGHCEVRVKRCPEGLAQVGGAVVSYEAGTTVVIPNGSVDDSMLRRMVEGRDYKVLDIQ